MIKVAVITRTKDRPLFLKRAIESVGNQVYEDYVHVIVNDGGAVSEIESLIDMQPNKIKSKIKLFHRTESSNAPDTIFNESIDRVVSEYVAIHDDDDTWHEDFLSETTKYLDGNKDMAGVVVKTKRVTEKLLSGSIKTIKSEDWMPEVRTISLYRQFIDNQLTPIAFLFRRSAYETVGKFSEKLPVVGDWEFGIRLLQKYDVGFIDTESVLAFYHHRVKAGDNSFSKHSHRKYVTMVANEYLRRDLEAGILGPGYIMSDLKYRDDSRNMFIKQLIGRGVSKALGRR